MHILKTILSSRIPTTQGEKKQELCREANNTYYLVTDDDADFEEYRQFPLLVNDDGTQWIDANRYMLWKINSNPKINHKTLYSIAASLKDFRIYCDTESIDYLVAPRKILRPPWLYRKHLFRESGKNNIELSTVKGRLSVLGGFYEWLATIEGVEFRYPMYSADTVSVKYVDKYGNPKMKEVESKDLGRVRVGGDRHGDQGYVIDEGRLRPLNSKEQTLLFEALYSLENPEMLFGFLIAILTGARMQTVYTLRLRQFLVDIKGEEDIEILVGPGTKCDVKGDKLYRLVLPVWLYRSIQTYISSSRAKTRREKARSFEDEMDQYVFLTRGGLPYYTAKEDIKNGTFDQTASGEAVRVFIYGRLKSWAEQRGAVLKFAFHDLRATFATNYLFGDDPSGQENGEIDIRRRLVSLKERMGHSSLITTEGYLKFKITPEEKARIQSNFEKYLKGMIGRLNEKWN